MTDADGCGTVPSLTEPHPFEAADRAVDFAQSVRRYHRRRTSRKNKQRVADLATAQDGIKSAMRPVRNILARYPFGPQTPAAEAEFERALRVSKALQAERRKLWKMQQPSPKRKPRRRKKR